VRNVPNLNGRAIPMIGQRPRAGAFFTLLVLAWPNGPVSAQRLDLPRETPFSFAGWEVRGSDSTHVRVRCMAGGHLPDSTRIEAHLAFSNNVRIVAGDSVRAWRVGGAPDMWDVLSQVPPGQNYEVGGRAYFTNGDSAQDVIEWWMGGRGTPGPNQVSSRLISERRRVGARWYRLGGPFLVPVDPTENANESDIMDHARVVRSSVVRDSMAVVENRGRRTLECVVCVDTRGAVAEVWDEWGLQLATDLRERIMRALTRRWVFAPARTAKGPASDCVRCNIHLRDR
jgi:hypothetical protein